MSPKNYGRQAKGKTIKSVSLSVEVVEWAEKQAQQKGLTFSAWMAEFLKQELEASEKNKPKEGS